MCIAHCIYASLLWLHYTIFIINRLHGYECNLFTINFVIMVTTHSNERCMLRIGKKSINFTNIDTFLNEVIYNFVKSKRA